MGKQAPRKSIDTPTKAKILRDFQIRGGANARGAAAATARLFGLLGSGGPIQVKLFDSQVRSGHGRRKYAGRSGRTSGFTPDIRENIDAALAAADIMTFK